jgi:hypothetical protein
MRQRRSSASSSLHRRSSSLELRFSLQASFLPFASFFGHSLFSLLKLIVLYRRVLGLPIS